MPTKIIIKCQVPLEPLIITSDLRPSRHPEGLVHEDVYYTPKELKEFANLFKQKSGGYVWD